MDTQEQLDLIECVRRGDNGAMERLYDAFGGVVFSNARRILRETSQAEEVVQDTFLQAWRDAATFDPQRGSLRAWLVVITRARALDRLRAHRSRATRLALFQRLEGGPARVEVDQNTERDSGRCHELASILAVLPLEERALVSLAFQEGLSHGAIAARLEQPLGTVKTRLRRILRLIRAGATADLRPFTWQRTPPPPRAPAALPLADVRVVAVDDDADTLRLTTLVLERAGATVTAVPSGTHALKCIRACLPDVLITDLEMPDQDGYGLLANVRGLSNQGAVRLPAIAFTAHGSAADSTRAQLAGFAALLAKPVRPALLVARVAEIAAVHTSQPLPAL